MRLQHKLRRHIQLPSPASPSTQLITALPHPSCSMQSCPVPRQRQCPCDSRPGWCTPSNMLPSKSAKVQVIIQNTDLIEVGLGGGDSPLPLLVCTSCLCDIYGHAQLAEGFEALQAPHCLPRRQASGLRGAGLCEPHAIRGGAILPCRLCNAILKEDSSLGVQGSSAPAEPSIKMQCHSERRQQPGGPGKQRSRRALHQKGR